jgi:amino acid transporter
VAFLLGGKPLQWFVVLVAVVGQVGSILSILCCNAYSMKALADLNMLPSWIGQLNSALRTPVAAIASIMSITSFISIFINWYQVNGGGAAFDNSVFAASTLTLLVNSCQVVVFFLLRYRDPHLNRPFRIPLENSFSLFLFCAPTLAISAFFLAVSEPVELAFLFILLFIGIVSWYVPVLRRMLHRRHQLQHPQHL